MQRVSIYELRDRILIHPWQRTTAGLGMASEPYLCLPLDADSQTLGGTVLSALSLSGQTVPHPTSWKGLATPRLNAAGVKSEKAFHSGTRSVTVERGSDAFRIEPSHNGGSTGDSKGFQGLPNLSSSAPLDLSATELAAEIRRCLGKCR